LNSVTDGGNGGAGARGEIWVISYGYMPQRAYGQMVG
jgi:hypothetical protein